VSRGFINILLHAHLPFVRHPEYSEFLEESWLFEALSETYLPLLRTLNRLHADQVPINISMSFSPTLISMLVDEMLQERYVQHLDKLIHLGELEVERTGREDRQFQPMARMYLELYQQNKQDYLDVYGRDIMSGFIRLAKSGQIELLTTPATYPFLPFYEHYPENVHAQIDNALRVYERVVGGVPNGMWIPEAGYFYGMENYLREHGVQYFFTSFQGMLLSPDVPRSGIYAPGRTANGLYFFPRDISSASLVWSAKRGYPGDPAYRDFYRDIGHDLPLGYISPFIHLGKNRVNTGYKYFAITGKTADKRPYDLAAAQAKLREHAQNFVFHHSMHMKKVGPLMSQPPISTSPYTAELFGHWWFEGVQWLDAMLRELQVNGDGLQSITPTAYLKQYPEQQKIQPIFASWGNKGYAETWLDGSNDWIYRHIHMAINKMVELTERFPDATGLKRRALNQAAREVLLMQSLDWSVIMRNGASAQYASNRLRDHLANFYKVYDSLGEGRLSTEWLTRVERKNNLFPDLDYLSFARRVRKK
jgi:1,4-alpha-glucan branching enzyme